MVKGIRRETPSPIVHQKEGVSAKGPSKPLKTVSKAVSKYMLESGGVEKLGSGKLPSISDRPPSTSARRVKTAAATILPQGTKRKH